MILKEINLKNIRSHENTLIRFSEGVNVITGNTGSGKSSILMGIQYALFGKIGEGQGEGKLLLRRGKANGAITINFTEEGSEYIVTRGLKRVKDAVRNDDSENEIIKDGKKIDLQNRAMDINSYILKILKISSPAPTKTFEAITYIKQDELKDLIFENGQSKQEYIDQLLQLNKYADTFDKLKEVINRIERELESSRLEESLSGDENEIIQIEADVGKLELNNADALKNLHTLELDLKSNEDSLEKIDRDIKIAREKQNKFIKLNAEHDAKLLLVGKYADQASVLKTDLENREKSIIKIDENTVNELKSLRNKKDTEMRKVLSEEKDLYEKFCTNDMTEKSTHNMVSKIKKEVETFSADIKKLENAVQETRQLIERVREGPNDDELKGRLNQIDSLIKELETEKLAAEKSGICQICGNKITNKQHLNTEYDLKIRKCTLEKDELLKESRKTSSGKTKKELETDFERLNIKISELRDRISFNESELEKIDLLNIAQKTLDSKEKYDATVKYSNNLRTEIDRVTKDIESIDSARAIINQVRINREKLDYLNSEEKKAKEEAGIIEANIQELGFDKNLLKEREEEVVEFTQIIKNISSGIAGIRSEIKAREREAAEKKVKLEEVKKRLQKKNELRKKIEKRSRFLTIMENLRKDIREIREYVRNRFISEFKSLFWARFLEIRADSDYTIDIDNNYNIKVIVGNETLDAKTLSGGEKTSVALAYRMALSSIASLLGGVNKNESLIMDEPTSGLDKEDINALSTCIIKIKDIRQIIIVTHEDTMKNIADAVITVTKTSGESKVR